MTIMNFSLDPQTLEIIKKLECFVSENILPLEKDPSCYDEHENINEETLEKIRSKAKSAGLWAPQMPKEKGGLGLNHVAMAAFYETANRSIFGPVCFNCSAPDDGNMTVLNKILDPSLHEKWLDPIINGSYRSAFAMTEPNGGCGSDPSLTYTRAEKEGNVWKIYGKKWFITGADRADVFILIAKTSDDTRKGLTAFLFHKDQPGWEITRRIPIMGPEEHGGHCELTFDGLEIPDEHRLLEIGDGLKVTQIRLGTARLTHCMRWLGLAKRSMEIASQYVENRESFGYKLSEHEGVQWMLGEVAANIQKGRLLTMHAAWTLDQGSFAKKEISMAKIHVSETLNHAADTCIQLCGAYGYSKDNLLEWIYRYARQAKLVDGASEIHKMVLSKTYLEEKESFFNWNAND
jgi:acyl-CoA dehydrogenase